MLNYLAEDETTKNIAIYYANQINNSLAESFFSGKISISSSAEAIQIAKCFWEMTELAVDDYLNDRTVLEGVDAQFLMQKLLNMVYGYYEKNGFKQEWKAVELENL
ncbi:MAG: hypothetical protein V4660_10045 [Pseudomonadota bacterium]